MTAATATRNNFTLMRLLFALLVLISHSYPLSGPWKLQVIDHDLGVLAVHGFFAISGYLVAGSFLRAPSIRIFATNRALRLVPGLIVALAFSKAAALLCDGFQSNPIPYVVNGPLWTLTWEVMCYIAVAVLGVCGMLAKNTLPAIVGAAWIAILANIHDTSTTMVVIVPMLLAFLMGTFIRVKEADWNLYRYGGVLTAGFVIVAITPLLYWMFDAASVIPFLWGPALTHMQLRDLLWFAVFPFAVIYTCRYAPVVLHIETDISYGVYVLGWPIQQLIVYIAHEHGFVMGPHTLMLFAIPMTCAAAYLSWHFVERVALNFKRRPETLKERVQ